MTSPQAALAAAPARIVLRPIGTGLPLGFFAFGTGMAVLAGVDIPLFDASQLHPAAFVLLTFVGPLELLACVLAYLARDAMAGTGLGLFAASWFTLGVQDLLLKPQQTSPVLALYLFAFSVVIGLLGVVALRGQPLLGLILCVSTVRTLSVAVYEAGGPKPLFHAGGWLALVITALAYYGALAFLLEDTAHRTVLPLGRRGQAHTALGGDLGDQLRSLPTEAGVRRSL